MRRSDSPCIHSERCSWKSPWTQIWVRRGRIVGAYGAGRIVNPKTTRSQCVGGSIGGIGMARMEHSVVDGRNGRVPNANFAEYAVPVHADSPPIMDVIFVEE